MDASRGLLDALLGAQVQGGNGGQALPQRDDGRVEEETLYTTYAQRAGGLQLISQLCYSTVRSQRSL
eukprot:3169904-Pyramimonas_sp.AAC.1